MGGDIVRYTGEPIAVVIAKDGYSAHDALDLITVNYQRLDAVVDPTEAAGENAPQLHDNVPDNVGFEWEVGDREATAEAFENAAYTVNLEFHNQRLAPNAIEPRVASLATSRLRD